MWMRILEITHKPLQQSWVLDVLQDGVLGLIVSALCIRKVPIAVSVKGAIRGPCPHEDGHASEEHSDEQEPLGDVLPAAELIRWWETPWVVRAARHDGALASKTSAE